jgi:hypothetical protein
MDNLNITSQYTSQNKELTTNHQARNKITMRSLPVTSRMITFVETP